MKKIVLAGLISDNNLGDKVIAECTQYLYENAIENNKDVVYDWIDIAGLTNIENSKPYLIRIIKARLYNLNLKIGYPGIQFIIKKFENYFKPLIKNHDLVVVVGGGLIKFKYQYFWAELSGLIRAADKLNIPLVLNAVGIEGYDEFDLKCQVLKKSLNSKCVQSITTRDDINSLQLNYLFPENKSVAKLVADSAVHAAEVYNINAEKSDLIGVGLIRGNIFKDNGLPLSKEKLVEFYSDLLSELEKRNLKYQLFTNGLESDLELVRDIFNYLGQEFDSKKILIPRSAKDLVSIICGFNSIIAARLHACIISYSLQIPCIGLVWNDKISMFGSIIGKPERFINVYELNAKKAVDQLLGAMQEGYDLDSVEKYKQTTKTSIRDILKINNIIG